MTAVLVQSGIRRMLVPGQLTLVFVGIEGISYHLIWPWLRLIFVCSSLALLSTPPSGCIRNSLVPRNPNRIADPQNLYIKSCFSASPRLTSSLKSDIAFIGRPCRIGNHLDHLSFVRRFKHANSTNNSESVEVSVILPELKGGEGSTIFSLSLRHSIFQTLVQSKALEAERTHKSTSSSTKHSHVHRRTQRESKSMSTSLVSSSPSLYPRRQPHLVPREARHRRLGDPL